MNNKTWALIAAAAFLYYITSQRKNVPIIPGFDPGSGPTTGPNPWDDTGFVAPSFPHTPTPAWAYSKVKVAGPNPEPDFGMGRAQYETGMNWPARDYIFG